MDQMNAGRPALLMFDVSGKVVVVTGGAGVLCSAMCRCLGERGARVVVLDRTAPKAETLAAEIRAASGEALGVVADVQDRAALEAAAAQVVARFGRVDALINGAGGNRAEGTTLPGERGFFDLPPEALRWVLDLNLMGTVLACQVFGPRMVAGGGAILNISSMAAFRPLTRVVAYSAAKAAVSNFTQWLAVYLAQEFGPAIRVNALAPGFFLTEQNRFLLTDEASGGLTARGEQILNHTPMRRFGRPDDLLGAMLWLLSDASSFVTGIIVPVDGGFSAYSGV
jgi:NAD(P)-dependent dehydrogenase (short-subunit alcohol dehydrogenase family)